jgi:hypothetical protein
MTFHLQIAGCHKTNVTPAKVGAYASVHAQPGWDIVGIRGARHCRDEAVVERQSSQLFACWPWMAGQARPSSV